MTIDISALFPRFILADKNGYAMAKALEAAMKALADTAQAGLDTWGDPEKMPEWRLDELAWEYDIPYDFTADIAIKRKWIADVYELDRYHGTPEGLRRYMESYYSDSSVEEAGDYGGDPFHFRLVFPDVWSQDRINWALKAVNKVKNVRSVLDGLCFDGDWPLGLLSGSMGHACEMPVYSVPAATVEDDILLDESGDLLMDEGYNVLTD